MVQDSKIICADLVSATMACMKLKYSCSIPPVWLPDVAVIRALSAQAREAPRFKYHLVLLILLISCLISITSSLYLDQYTLVPTLSLGGT